MIASEAQPFSKTGGLADVATALPKALGRLGHDVTLITPRYRGVAAGRSSARVSIEMAAHRFKARADRSAASAPGAPRAAARLPGALRSRRHLLRRRAAISPTTPCATRCCPRPRSTGRRSKTSRSTSFTRTTGRAGSRRCMRAPSLGTHAPRHACFTIHNLAYQGIFDKRGCRGSVCGGATSRSTASSSSID